MAESALQKIVRLSNHGSDPQFIELYNQNHDDRGEFSSGGGSGGGDKTQTGKGANWKDQSRGMFHAHTANVTTASGHKMHLQVVGGFGKNHLWQVHEGHSEGLVSSGHMHANTTLIKEGGGHGLSSTDAKAAAESAVRDIESKKK